MEIFNKNKGVFYALGIVILIVAVVAYFSKTSSATPAPNNEQQPTPGNASETFPLKFGSRGQKVRDIQTALQNLSNKKALPVFGIDGIWGAETAAAVSKYYNVSQITEEKYNEIIK